MTPEQTDAAHKAANYRAAETKINDQIKTFDGKQLSPADKKYVSQLHKLAARNKSRAANWEARARD